MKYARRPAICFGLLYPAKLMIPRRARFAAGLRSTSLVSHDFCSGFSGSGVGVGVGGGAEVRGGGLGTGFLAAAVDASLKYAASIALRFKRRVEAKAEDMFVFKKLAEGR